MKNALFFAVVLFSSIHLQAQGFSADSGQAGVDASGSLSVFLNDLPHVGVYRAFSPGDKVSTVSGFGFYRIKARADLRVEDSSLVINYGLPFALSWGNWLSIRRQFAKPADLKNWSGIEFEIKVDSASYHARLRLALCDTDPKMMKATNGEWDNLWWCDFSESALQVERDWTTVKAPFSSFSKSYGAGARKSSLGRINLSMVTAYEISLITNGNSAKGQIRIRNPRAYKE